MVPCLLHFLGSKFLSNLWRGTKPGITPHWKNLWKRIDLPEDWLDERKTNRWIKKENKTTQNDLLNQQEHWICYLMKFYFFLRIWLEIFFQLPSTLSVRGMWDKAFIFGTILRATPRSHPTGDETFTPLLCFFFSFSRFSMPPPTSFCFSSSRAFSSLKALNALHCRFISMGYPQCQNCSTRSQSR